MITNLSSWGNAPLLSTGPFHWHGWFYFIGQTLVCQMSELGSVLISSFCFVRSFPLRPLLLLSWCTESCHGKFKNSTLMWRLHSTVCSFPVYWKNVRFCFSKHQAVFLKSMVILRIRIIFLQIGFKKFDKKNYCILIISIRIETFWKMVGIFIVFKKSLPPQAPKESVLVVLEFPFWTLPFESNFSNGIGVHVHMVK